MTEAREKAKFTPGPWSANFAHDNSGTVYAWHIAAPEFGSSRPICSYSRISEVSDEVSEGSPRPSDEDRANANLIAAAPDLYEALKAAEGHLAETLSDARWHPIGKCPVLELVRAALSKAEGASQ